MAKTATVAGTTWGIPLAMCLVRNGYRVTLWEYDPELAGSLQRERSTAKFPGLALPDAVHVTSDLPHGEAIGELLVIAVPSQHVRWLAGEVGPIPEGALAAIAAKGLEMPSLMRLSEVVSDVMSPVHLAAVSGPCIAVEVARGVPTAAVAASEAPGDAERLRDALMTERFRIYTSDDLPGVELGGSLKNIIAIAAGLCDGLGFGDNTKAGLITRGLAEIARLGVVLGARGETFSGLSGMGDLVVTAFSPHSRNRRLGEAIARGRSLEEAQAALGQVAEGVRTAESAQRLSSRVGVEMPITEQVCRVLFEGESPQEAVESLMLRQPKAEPERLR